MQITIIYDNTTSRDDLRPDWGFACLVKDDDGNSILFDTGADGELLLGNMERLGIEPASIGEVFLSHNHFDHVGGLSAFLNVRPDVRVFCPRSLRGVRKAREVITVGEGPLQIHEGVFSTGELEGVEQSLVVRTVRGLVLVVGCSHPGMASILSAASAFGRVSAIIGGLHGFSELELFAGLECICPTHCTAPIREIPAAYPEAYIPGGAGRVITL